MNKSIKAPKYDAEGALLVLELAFYQHGNLNSVKEMDAGNEAVRRCGQAMITNKRVPGGLFVYIDAILKAPNPIQMITEAWAQFHSARAEESAALAKVELAANKPAYVPRKKKKKKKLAPAMIDPEKPLTHSAVAWMKDALKNKMDKIEQKRKERVTRIGKAGHHADSVASIQLQADSEMIGLDKATA